MAFMSLVPPLNVAIKSGAKLDTPHATVRQPRVFLAQIGGVVKATTIGNQALPNNP
jgi:hypothetical protein